MPSTPSRPPAVIAAMHDQMKHLAARQRVIAQNIANSETAGYKARELEPPDFSALLARAGAAPAGAGGAPRVARPQVALTDAMTALGASPSAAGAGLVADAHTTETKPDGNNVTLEEQLLKMGQVQADFAALANLYRKTQGLLRTALGRGQ